MSEKIIEAIMPTKDDDLETLIQKMELLNSRLNDARIKNPVNTQEV